MWAFLADLFRDLRTTYTVVLVEDAEIEAPRQHRIVPQHLLVAWGGSLVFVVALTICVIAFTPVRQLIPGYTSPSLQEEAQLNAVRVAAMQDSLEAQRQYIEQLQQLLTGDIDGADPDIPSSAPSPTPQSYDMSPGTGSASDHRQPALPIQASSTTSSTHVRPALAEEDVLPALPMPMVAPVESGYPTRGFDPRARHYALDIAVQEGTSVRTVGDGYVVFADWTQEGGYTVAVQHAGGYLSIYKHNKQLVKQVGDRVRAQEIIATSGDSGELTTGPHLHFEIWHHGLAQDPRSFIPEW